MSSCKCCPFVSKRENHGCGCESVRIPIVSFFDMISAVRFGAGEPSDGFDLSGLIQALSSIHFGSPSGSTSWLLDFSPILEDLHTLRITWHDWASSCSERVWSWLTSLGEVFRFFKRDISVTEWLSLASKYVIAALTDQGEDYLKFQTNYLACRLFKQAEYPERPATLPSSELSGLIFPSQHRWFFHRLRNASERLQFGYSLIQFKRGCKPVSVVKRVKALAKHAKALGRQAKTAEELSTWVKEVRRTVRETLNYGQAKVEESLLPPSTSAHFGLTRAEYGALPRMKEHAEPHSICENHTSLTFSIFDCACHKWLIADQEPESVPTENVEQWNQTSYYSILNYGVVPKPAVDDVAVSVSVQVAQPPSDLKGRLMEEGFWNSDEDHRKCEVHLVLEPFKVRTITAGSALFGYLGRYWQRAIHKKVGEHPVFEYTHAPVSFGSIRAAFGSVPPENVIVSGDYEAATDNIEMELTKAAWTECVEYLYSDESDRKIAIELGESMLSGQNLQYGKALAKAVGWKSLTTVSESELVDILFRFGVRLEQEQTQGQLMGCILSFFLLCMINATTVRVPFERFYKRRFRLSDLPIRINGDDVLFHARPEVVEDWKRCALECGLKPSLGKNFVSREFGMINSEMYRFERKPLQVFRYTTQIAGGLTIRKGGLDGYTLLPEYLEPTQYVPYLNLGLLTGSGRVQEDTRVDRKFLFGDDRTESAGARARALVKGYSRTKGVDLIQRFISLNRDVLSSTTRGWGIPEALGGLGIPYVDNHSTEGLVVAAYLDRADPDLYENEVRLIKGSDLNPPPHVAIALAISSKVMKKAATKRWGTEEERCKSQLPLLVGATWIGCEMNEHDSRRTMDPEKCYRRLVRAAINSGVRAMKLETLERLRDKVVVYDFDEKVKSQMEAWIPSINHRLITDAPFSWGQFVGTSSISPGPVEHSQTSVKSQQAVGLTAELWQRNWWEW